MAQELIRKANSFIEARYKVSLLQMKILLKLASVIKLEDQEFTIYSFSVRELLEEFECGTENHHNIIEATRGLISHYIETIDEKGKRSQYTLLSQAEYSNGVVDLCFSPRMRTLLLGLNNRVFHKDENGHYVLSEEERQQELSRIMTEKGYHHKRRRQKKLN
jgi:hypothetical protein